MFILSVVIIKNELLQETELGRAQTNSGVDELRKCSYS